MAGLNAPGDPSTVPKHYENFDLLIERTRRRYRVQLLGSPTGEAPPKSRHSFSDKDLKSLLGSGEVWRDLHLKTPVPKTPEEIGSELFRALISGEIRSRWDTSLQRARLQGLGLRLRLRLGEVPELEERPWELLYDRSHGQFLSLSKDISIVRYLENPTPSGLEELSPPIKMLVVIANPIECGRIDGEREWELLNRALDRLVKDGQVLIERLRPPTLPALEQAMNQFWHIVHFVGHGQFDSEEGRLLLEDESGRREEVPGSKLRVLLENQKELRLVVLNACVGARTSQENAFAGVAQSLVRLGVPAVVAMRSGVSDRAALAFAARLYKGLAEELPIDSALSEARRGMHAGGDDLEWSTPVLYIRSQDGRIIEIEKKEELPPKPLPWRGLLAAALSAAALSGGYWLSTLPDRSGSPDCPSPPGLDMSFVRIKPGRFAMGSKGRLVEITHPFCLGKFEVTQRQWKEIMGAPPRQAKEGDDLPVGNVSWNDAKLFLTRLAASDPSAHYRLPTEAQWEYAARAGTSSLFSFGDNISELIHYGNCSKTGIPTPIGSFWKNPWGLYDMYGNVTEWVEDWEGPLPEKPAADPTGPETGRDKVRRGGSFKYKLHCNSTYRASSLPDHRDEEFGFRVVRDPVK